MSGPWEKYAAPVAASASAASTDGPWAKYAPAEPSLMSEIGQQIGNVAAGAVRGAGSIGATILAPVDAAARALNDGKPVNIGGFDIVGQDRRAGMDAGLQTLGAETDSLAFRGGKLAGEIAGTAGVGGALARGAAAVPGLAAKAPGVIEAVRTAGMTGPNMAARTVGGGITGGASAALVNPEQAETGAAVGAALPGVLKLAGTAGNAAGRALRGPEQTADMAAAVKAARDAGYVIPPTQARASLANRLLEGFSGKITTAQNASARNQSTTNSLAAKALGLPADVKITPEALKQVRDIAGQTYDNLGSTGVLSPGPAYENALKVIEAPFIKTGAAFPNAKPSPVIDLVESLRSPSFDAAAAVEKVKQLRSAADDAFRAGNTDVARASRAGAKALEDALETHLQGLGSPQLLDEFREARKLIAKTYSVEKALNPASGSVDAKKLAAQAARGKPLSGEIKTIADFAGRFPKANQTVEAMGSLPQTSPLDWGAAGTLSALMGNPMMMAGVLARPGARALTLSGPVQNRLVQGGVSSLARLPQSPSAQALLYRGAPVAWADQ